MAETESEQAKPSNRHKAGFRGPSPDVGKATQFKPGNCANRGGRPKKLPITALYQEMLNDGATVDMIRAALLRLISRGMGSAEVNSRTTQARDGSTN